MRSRDISVGFSGIPLHPIVCLYDVMTNYGGGVDLYFADIDDLLATARLILAKAEQMEEESSKSHA